MNKICVTVKAGNSDEMLKKLKELSKDHDFFEVRLDYLHDLSEQTIETIFRNLKVNVIATLRSVKEGGKFSGPINNYTNYVEQLFATKAEYVDIELSRLQADSNLIKIIQPMRTIISYHNFDLTPDKHELEQIVSSMKGFSEQAIYKIACMVNEPSDLDRLVNLQKNFEDRKATVIGMGEKGRLLRVLGPSIGAFTSFASSEITPVAPGQLYYKSMKDIINSEKIENGRQ